MAFKGCYYNICIPCCSGGCDDKEPITWSWTPCNKCSQTSSIQINEYGYIRCEKCYDTQKFCDTTWVCKNCRKARQKQEEEEVISNFSKVSVIQKRFHASTVWALRLSAFIADQVLLLFIFLFFFLLFVCFFFVCVTLPI